MSRAAPSDPVALWAYLYTMGGRRLPLGREFFISQSQPQVPLTDQEESVPPLEHDELEHMMSCYRSLRARRPELAQALVLINVSDELKRANRLDLEEQFYREALAGSTGFGQIAGAFILAARRGDAGGLIQLFERYDRLQTGRQRTAYSTGSFAFSSPGLAMSQGMSALADKKDYAGVIRLLDFNLAFARRKQEALSPGATIRALRARYTALGFHRLRPDVIHDLVGPALSPRGSHVSPGQRILRCQMHSGLAHGLRPVRARRPPE